MTTTTLIGISGKRGSGKSLLGTCLEKYGFKRISLACSLKTRCIMDFGLSWDQVHGDKKETPTQYRRTDGTPLTARDIMIRMGIFYRSIDPLFWCKEVLKTYPEHLPPSGYVIDDIRFLNEINFFKEHYNAKFIRIEREAGENPYKAALDDLSETELDTYKDWDHILIKELNHAPHDLEVFAEYLGAHHGR